MSYLGLRKRKRIVLLLAILVVFVISFFAREYLSNIYVGYTMDEIEVPGENDRVLVFAPHSDDEALGAATMIKRSIQNGAEVMVVIATNGDGFRRAVSIEAASIFPKPQDYINYGYTRQSESINALQLLGLDADRILFLGYPDRGISSMWSLNWKNDIPYRSKYTKTEKSPYNNNFGGEVLFSGQNLYNDIVEILLEFQPTHIIYPHSNDRHPDHWALNAFIKYAITCTGYTPRHEWLYLVHRGGWPTPFSRNRNIFLVPPMSLLNAGTEWLTLEISEEEIEEKSRVFKKYKSQIKRISALMAAFERRNELFGIYDNIKLVRYNRHDAEIEISDDNKIINDPKKDSLNLEVRKSSDIIGIFAEVSIEGNLHIFVRLNDKMDIFTVYDLNMIFIGEYDTLPITLSLRGKSLNVIEYTGASMINNKDVKYVVENKVLHLIIPEEKIIDYEHIFVNARSSINNIDMDRSAWRMIDVEN